MITSDPTHLNDVRLIDDALAARHPGMTAGDVLVSLRNLNAVGVLDLDRREFTWIMTGATILQHSPRFHGSGILVLDNLGGMEATGGSQLVEIDLKSRRCQTIFPRAGVKLPGVFSSPIAGHLDLAHGNRALVTVWGGSKLWEIDLDSGEVIWEYIYVDPVDGHGRHFSTSKYVRAASFEMNGGRVKLP
jgi:hypothetical protein